MADGSEAGKAFDWRTTAEEIREYVRISGSTGFQDVTRLWLVAPRAHREAVQGCVRLIENQRDALDGLTLSPDMPGARLIDSLLSTQKYCMRAQTEFLKGYLDLVDRTLNLLRGKDD